MELRDQSFENEWVRLDTLEPTPEMREFIKETGAVEAMWKWMPRLPNRGTTYNTYFEHVVAEAKSGKMLPLLAYSQDTGAFVGGTGFLRINRTHRSAQIDYVWTPPEVRGTSMALAIQAAMIQGAINWRAKRVYWLVDSLNTRYAKFISEKVGARKEGEFESYARMNDGRWSNMGVYALVGDRLTEAVARIKKTLEKEFPSPD